MPNNLSPLTNLLAEAVKLAGNLALTRFHSPSSIQTSYKSKHKELVTQVDLEIQDFLQEFLTQGMQAAGYNPKEVGFLGEEGLFQPGKYMFVIDPLDGTKNFCQQQKHFAIALALFVQSQLQMAAIATPAHNKIYLAQKHTGSWVAQNGYWQPLKSQPCSLNQAIVNCDTHQIRFLESTLIPSLAPIVKSLNKLKSSSVELAWTAENIFNLTILTNQKIWDIAPGKLIVEEAGGAVVDWRNLPFELDPLDPEARYFAIAGHPQNLQQILPYLNIGVLDID
jgi:myo-inositol-1(or 4)-monophosphatase